MNLRQRSYHVQLASSMHPREQAKCINLIGAWRWVVPTLLLVNLPTISLKELPLLPQWPEQDTESIQSSIGLSKAEHPLPEGIKLPQEQLGLPLKLNSHSEHAIGEFRSDELTTWQDDHHGKTSNLDQTQANQVEELMDCQLLGPDSSMPLRTGSKRMREKRSLRKRCTKQTWANLLKKLRRKARKTRQRMTIWLLRFLAHCEVQWAKRSLIYVKLARWFRIKW